jgi:DNA-binding GntR family transcriptional regulator
MLQRRRARRPTPIGRLPSQLTVREVAYERLRQLIVESTAAPGERIFENALGEELGVSRTPLCETLPQLQTECLVDFSARRAAVVAGLSAAEMREEFQIRASLEGLAIRLSSPRLTADDLKQPHRELEHMTDALGRGDPSWTTRLNWPNPRRRARCETPTSACSHTLSGSEIGRA